MTTESWRMWIEETADELEARARLIRGAIEAFVAISTSLGVDDKTLETCREKFERPFPFIPGDGAPAPETLVPTMERHALKFAVDGVICPACNKPNGTPDPALVVTVELGLQWHPTLGEAKVPLVCLQCGARSDVSIPVERAHLSGQPSGGRR